MRRNCVWVIVAVAPSLGLFGLAACGNSSSAGTSTAGSASAEASAQAAGSAESASASGSDGSAATGPASASAEASTQVADPVKVACENGVMLGKSADGVTSFKGIPFAKPPVGELRWKAPQAPGPSDAEIECYEFGYTALQTECHTEKASYYPKNEDCLTLNIWESDGTVESDKPKPVMVFFHGGAYGWGGTTDPVYDGQNFAKARGLFKRAIAQSGQVAPKSREAAQAYADYIMKASGAKNMDELLAISGDEWMKIDAEKNIADECCYIVVDGDSYHSYREALSLYNDLEDDSYAGAIDPAVAAKAQEAWVNFAKTGDPSISDAEWKPYNTDTRDIMVIEKDKWKCVPDPSKAPRELLVKAYGDNPHHVW